MHSQITRNDAICYEGPQSPGSLDENGSFPHLLRVGILLCISALPCVILALWNQAIAQEAPAVQGERSLTTGSYVIGRVAPIATTPLRAGEVNRLTIDSKGFDIVDVQVKYLDHSTDGDASVIGEIMTVTPRREADGQYYIEIAPEVLGPVEVSLQFHFTDGNFENTSFQSVITLTDNPPKSLDLETEGVNTPILTLNAGGLNPINEEHLYVNVIFQNASRPVRLKLSQVELSVISQPSDTPAISIDSESGTVTSIHPGHALIDASFRGIHVLKCVFVNRFRGDGYQISDCSDLVPAGMDSLLMRFTPLN